VKEGHLPYTFEGQRVWVAGHRGMVGRALVNRLASENCDTVTVDRESVDLRDQSRVLQWIRDTKPNAVIVAAATVGGIVANSERPALFLHDNLVIAANVIHASYLASVEKLLFLGSSCIYPRDAPQPMSESALLTGSLEPTNEWYAVAKIAGIKLCQAYRRQYGCDFISAMPTNLYGPGDNFHPRHSHVVAALMQRAHEAKLAGKSGLEIWGTGKPRREFLYVEDAADGLIHLMKHYSDESHVNIGCGMDHTIEELATLICETVSLPGSITYRTEMPDGTPQKLLNVARMTHLGWQAKTSLRDGLAKTYDWFGANSDVREAEIS
jgi:GDP-L-fucose synthase